MTEMRVIIDLDREATPDQMVSLQDGIEDSIDHIVGDTIIPDRGYAGMLATVAGTVVTIGAGRLYNGSKVFAFDTATSIDMQSKLPLATKRKVLIIAYGTETDTDVAEVNFLQESESTPAAPVYKPQSVATTHRRLAVVQPAYGDEAPNPPTPDIGLALAIAQITLTPAGIASCTNILDGMVPVLSSVASRTSALETFQATVSPQVSSLASDLASLANSLKSSASQQVIARILISVADLDAKVGIPTTAADSSSDYLLTGANSDLTHALSSCKVAEGIRFPDDGVQAAVLNLFNPFETAGVVKGGVLFAAYDRYLRRTTGPATANVAANSYTYNPVSYTQKTVSTSRVRYGSSFTVCSNSAFWQSGTYDPITGIFALPDGSTYRAAVDLTSTGDFLVSQNADVSGTWLTQHAFYRLQQFWTDSSDTTYWDAVVQAPQVIPGYHLAETELIGQDQWVDAIGFYLDKLDAQGAMTVLVCEAGDNAAPDPSGVLARVDIPFANLVVGENVAALATPVFLEAGKRISYVVVTTGAHSIETTDGANFPQGTFFVLSPSGYAQGDLTKHLRLNVYGCKFRQAVASINLQNLQLAGGITSIDILAETIVPASTVLSYEIQIAGLWVPLSAATTGQLNAGGSLPPNLPLRVTMAGTPDMMPSLGLAKSNAIVTRPKTSFAHVWPKLPRTPPVSTSQIRVIERYESYDPAFHSAGCKLLTGAGYLTQTAPSSFSDVVGADGSLQRTYVFNLGAAVTSYKVLTTGTTLSALNTFHGAWIKDYVL